MHLISILWHKAEFLSVLYTTGTRNAVQRAPDTVVPCSLIKFCTKGTNTGGIKVGKLNAEFFVFKFAM